MNFVTGLPDHQRCNGIFVCVEKLTKLVRFIPFRSGGGSLTAEEVASLFFKRIVHLYRVPKCIMYDRDPRFTGNFWRSLFAIMDSRFLFSSAYHPQTDGPTEQMNKIFEQVLRTMAVDVDGAWVDKLLYVEFAINQLVNASTGKLPFELVYGQPVATMDDLLDGQHANESTQQMATNVFELVAKAKERLQAAKGQQSSYFNHRLRPIEFSVGDQVMLSSKYLGLSGTRRF